MGIAIRCFFTAIFMVFLTGFSSPAPANDIERHYEEVTALLSEVRHSEDLPNTVHRNPLVLNAVELFLRKADPYNMSNAELHRILRSLFPLLKWGEWVPQFEIRKVKEELYLFSLGYAASTQESSLYLFRDSGYLLIDSGEAGLIEIEDMASSDAGLKVTYVRTPGSTRPDEIVATLKEEAGRWRVAERRLLVPH